MDLLTMYPAKLGSPQTILASNLAADATAMVVSDASVLPEAPNIAVIGTDENCEIISYSAIDSSTNTVTISARGLGDSTAKAWTSGTTVARNHSSLDHNTLMANIASLNTGKAEAVHDHDDRYYTESEMDTALAGKQNTLTFDSTPSPSSINPVTSGGIKTYVDNRILYFSSGGNNAMSVNVATNAQIGRIPASGTDSRITTDTVVLSCVFADQSAVSIVPTWTSYDGYVVFTGTCIKSTTANVILGQKGN